MNLVHCAVVHFLWQKELDIIHIKCLCLYRRWPCGCQNLRMIRLLVVELIHLSLNFRFVMSIIFMINYFLVRDDVSVDNKMPV
jgi:hypothetical protein